MDDNEKFDQLYERVGDIHRVLVGDSEYHQKGLIERVGSLEEAEQKKNKYFWMGAGMISLSTILSNWKTIKGFFEL